MREATNALAISSLTAFWSVVAAGFLPFRGKRGVSFVATWWAKSVNKVCGVDVEIEPPPVPLDAPAYVVMANHSSHFDVLALYATMPRAGEVRPVAKRELGYIPVFGWVLAAGAAIMIDRGDKEKALRSIERAGATIRAGASVLMFPEGTRTPTGELGPLKKGPFHLALEAQVPVLPVGIVGTRQVLKPGDWRIHPGKVRVRVGTPIPTAGLTDNPEDRAHLMAQVESALRALTTPDSEA
ncbi:MAG: 1-acyl-sn-glycerol-3-phosphate acyltransferase [Deltaproteobacteria bacterium]|nr:1-acyl-sn-glycerol-3-phosphate acyltransferase [Deltaproteobacteria bacterium]